MNKLFTKIAGLSLGLSLAIGVGVAVGSKYSGKNAEPVMAALSTATINKSSTGYSDMGSGNYNSGTLRTLTSNGVTLKGHYLCRNPKNTPNPSSADTYINFQGSNGHIYNVAALSTIQSITLNQQASTNAWTLYCGTSQLVQDSSTGTGVTPSGTAQTTPSASTSLVWNVSSGNYTYFAIKKGSGTGYVSSIVISYGSSTVTLSFNANGHGTAPSSQSITSGGKATQPTAPTATGWTFGGWYENSSCTGSAWNFNTTISADKTLWAKWTATTYSISYNLDGGTHGSTHPTSGTYDTVFSVSAPTKTGYTFTGWTVTAGLNSSTAKWGTTNNPSTAISSASTKCVNGTNAVYFKNINAASTAVTLTATWSINSYTISGSISNGSLSSTANVNYNSALDITINPDQDYTHPSSIDSVTMGGATYAGYTYDSSDGSFYIEHVTGNVVITASCVDASATEYLFNYDLTNCTIENAPESMYDSEMKELQIVPDEHYKLPAEEDQLVDVTGALDWYYDEDDGTIVIDGAEDDLTVTVECIAKAQNTISMGTLTGVSASGSNPTSVEEGETVTLTFTANTGYGLPSSVTVTGAAGSEWNQGEGELEITGGTSESISVSIIGIQRDLTNGNLTLGNKKTSYTTGDDFELPSTVTANFNIEPLAVDVKNNVEISGPVIKNNSKYIVTGSGTVVLTYTYEPTGSTQSASYAITATSFEPSTGGIAKITNISDLTIDSTVYLVCESESKQLSGISTTSTKYGLGDDYTTAPSSTVYPLTVEAGYSSGTYSFKNGSNYLYWTSGNSLNVNTTKGDDNKTSWVVTINSSGNALLANKSDTTREIWWNVSSPRFACYTDKTEETTGYAPVQLYKNYPATSAELKWITATAKSGTYYKGNSVTASDFNVIGHYNDGTTQAITSGITVTDGYLANVGVNNVTVSASGFSYTATVTAVQASVSSLELDVTSASIGLDESYWLSDISVTISPSIAIQDYTWSLYDDGGLEEGVDYTFDGDEYHSINPGTVVFRCTSDADESKYADFTLTISGVPTITIAESSFDGYVGKGDTIHFVYGNISDDDLGKINFVSSDPLVVDFADGIDAGSGSGSIEIEYLSAGSATISVNFNGGETLDTVSVTVTADSVVSVTWSATNIDVWSGATLSTAGWNVQYEMASGDHGSASSYVIKLVGQSSTETITAGYAFKGADNGKTIHVEYGEVSSSSITVTVTQRINDVWADEYTSNTKTWTAVAASDFGKTISSTEGTDSGTVTFDDKTEMAYTRTLEFVASGKADYLALSDGYIQFGSSNALEKLVLVSQASGIVKSISVDCWSKDGATTISVTVGGQAFGTSQSTPSAKNSSPIEFTGSATGEIVITMEKTDKTAGNAQYIKSVEITYDTKSGTTQIANNESHKVAQRAVVKFAKAFNDAVAEGSICSVDPGQSGTTTAWTACQTAYNTFLEEAASDLAYAKNLIRYATKQYTDDSDAACVERMIMTYTTLVGRGYTAFMSEIVSAGRVINPVQLSVKNSSAVIVIIVISSLSAAAIGGYFLFRRRKEQ